MLELQGDNLAAQQRLAENDGEQAGGVGLGLHHRKAVVGCDFNIRNGQLLARVGVPGDDGSLNFGGSPA